MCDMCCHRQDQGSDEDTPARGETITEEAAAAVDAAGKTPKREHTGAAIIASKRHAAYLELSRYKEDLIAVEGTCLLYSGLGEAWDHTLSACPWRFDFFKARDRGVRKKGGAEGEPGWIAAFHAYYWCYNPQSVCWRAGSEARQGECTHGDVVMPLCYGLSMGLGGAGRVLEYTGKSFKDVDDFFLWCGGATAFGGGKTICGVRVAAQALAELVPG